MYQLREHYDKEHQKQIPIFKRGQVNIYRIRQGDDESINDDVRDVVDNKIHQLFSVKKIRKRNRDGTMKTLRNPVPLNTGINVFKNMRKCDGVKRVHEYLASRHLEDIKPTEHKKSLKITIDYVSELEKSSEEDDSESGEKEQSEESESNDSIMLRMLAKLNKKNPPP